MNRLQSNSAEADMAFPNRCLALCCSWAGQHAEAVTSARNSQGLIIMPDNQ